MTPDLYKYVSVNKEKLFIEQPLNSGWLTNPWQDRLTPYEICNELISNIENILNKGCLVWNNLEIVHLLLYKFFIPEDHIYYIADTQERKEFAKKIWNVRSNIITELDKKEIAALLNFKSTSGWLTIGNYSWNKKADLIILDQLEKMFYENHLVNPAGWLLNQKIPISGETLARKLKRKLKNRVEKVRIFNGNVQFHGLQLNVPVEILKIVECNDSGIIDVDFFGTQYKASIYDISYHSDKHVPIVIPLRQKLEAHISSYGNVEDKIIKWNNDVNINPNKYYVCITGHINGSTPDTKEERVARMFNDDFWIIIEKHKLEACKTVPDRIPEDYLRFKFDTEIERDNFIKYLTTNFARFCLSILKVSKHICRGELKLIPWLDFNQEWTDERLFDLFELDIDSRNYINSFFPDNYYGRGEPE